MLFTFMNKRIDSFYYSKTRKQVRDDQENLVKSRLVNFVQMELLVVRSMTGKTTSWTGTIIFSVLINISLIIQQLKLI